MSFVHTRYTMEVQLKRTRQELKNLKEAKKVIQTQKPVWKQYFYKNHGVINIRRNSLIEQGEMYYPWYPTLENKQLYNTLSFLEPFSIRLFHVYCNKRKPYEIQFHSPVTNRSKSKRFSTLEKATKYTLSLKQRAVTLFEIKIKEIDKVISQKEQEVLANEKAYNIFCNTQQNNRQKSIS